MASSSVSWQAPGGLLFWSSSFSAGFSFIVRRTGSLTPGGFQGASNRPCQAAGCDPADLVGCRVARLGGTIREQNSSMRIVSQALGIEVVQFFEHRGNIATVQGHGIQLAEQGGYRGLVGHSAIFTGVRLDSGQARQLDSQCAPIKLVQQHLPGLTKRGVIGRRCRACRCHACDSRQSRHKGLWT